MRLGIATAGTVYRCSLQLDAANVFRRVDVAEKRCIAQRKLINMGFGIR